MKRSSGVILHITSLPSPFGIGDLGPSAYQFADFMAKASLRYWQILPLNPVDEGNAYSPYSGLSTFAGNTMMISPELLVKDGYLQPSELENTFYFMDKKVDYSESSAFKQFVFAKAFQRFNDGVNPQDQAVYSAFCQEHSFWLHDYARFVAIKDYHRGADWGRWKSDIRDRDPEALRAMDHKLKDVIEREKFLQFIFFKQWGKLKEYCQQRNILFIGDLPFYVSYDSSDVWSNPELFLLDHNRKPRVVSGVPPDYFSETGQLWGTPIFNWKLMQERGYEWWYKRIGQNLKWCDMIRLDHFRAFSAYWEVPAGEETAINGYWVEGPGADLFEVFRNKFPSLPFIAEDLGTIDQPVKDLMQKYSLPGMKVLLFAFGGDTADNPYVPHHHVVDSVVYTGTHDNNTSRGWWQVEADNQTKENAESYLHRRIKEDEVHQVLVATALMSVAQLAIIPLQDYLGLGKEAIMNKPGTVIDNWCWRVASEQMTDELAAEISASIHRYGRA